MFENKSEEKNKCEIPNDAIKKSEEMRNPPQHGKLVKKTRDSFNEDKMSRNVPSDETVFTTKPDDTVFPG